MIRTTLQSALCLCLAPMLVAQETVSARLSNPNPKLQAAPQILTLKKGTQIKFLTLEEVSSASAVNGHLIPLKVAEDVWQNGSLVVRAGTPGTGKVSDVKRAIAGKGDGYVDVDPVSFTREDGKRVKLRKYAPGEDACGDFGPCWIGIPVLTIFLIISSPVLIASLGSGHKQLKHLPAKHPLVKGEDYVLQAHSPCWGFTSSRITFRPRVPAQP
jgi:hypothetical protein